MALAITTLEHRSRADDPAVYDMLCKGDSIGVFQVESRAQINMLPRLKPREALRSGHPGRDRPPRPDPGRHGPSLSAPPRGQGEGRVSLARAAARSADELHELLGKTFGVPLFQEQAMKLAIVAADFTPREANQLRRAMATFRNVGTHATISRRRWSSGMVARGYERDFAERCFEQIEGFGSYGFPESHALSFARLVYVSSWIKCHHPAVFACALLNSQPMGFYAPAQIVRDAREHGVEVRADRRQCQRLGQHAGTRDDGALALRLGFRQIDGFREEWADAIVAARARRLRQRSRTWPAAPRLPARALRLLADADAFRSIGARPARGAVGGAAHAARRSCRCSPPPRRANWARSPMRSLPAMPLAEHVVADYQTTRLSLKGHPMAVPARRSSRAKAC